MTTLPSMGVMASFLICIDPASRDGPMPHMNGRRAKETPTGTVTSLSKGVNASLNSANLLVREFEHILSCTWVSTRGFLRMTVWITFREKGAKRAYPREVYACDSGFATARSMG